MVTARVEEDAACPVCEGEVYGAGSLSEQSELVCREADGETVGAYWHTRKVAWRSMGEQGEQGIAGSSERLCLRVTVSERFRNGFATVRKRFWNGSRRRR